MGSGFDVEVSKEQIGIIPRAIQHLFGGIESRIEKAQDTGSLVPEFKVMAQFMELYNEEVIDLFNPAYNKVSPHVIFNFITHIRTGELLPRLSQRAY